MKPKVLFFFSVTFLLLLGSAPVGFSQSPQPVSFQVLGPYGVGIYPGWIAVGDFTGKGKLDLAVANGGANIGSNNVSVLLGNGDGTFQPAVNYPIDGMAVGITVGDFNGDGYPDLAVGNSYTNSVSVLLNKGHGSGTFYPAEDYPVGLYSGPNSVTVGDFNGDGKLDLAVANYNGTVSVLLGKGNGTFQTVVSYPVASSASSVVVGDFNGDGCPDLAVANNPGLEETGTVSVLLNNCNATGTFQTAVSYPVGTAPSAVAVGDFNGDGCPDLAVANDASFNVSVLLNNCNGTGTFQAAVDSGPVSYPYSLAVGDLNGDGILDLAVADVGTTSLSFLLGNGDGTFQAAVWTSAAVDNPWAVAVGDFNGDGKPDVAWVNTEENGTVGVLLNTTTPLIQPLVSTGGTNTYQFGGSLFSYSVTYPALSDSPVNLAVWPARISQADLNARLAGQYLGATLVPYGGASGDGVLFRVTCLDSSGNTVTCPQTTGPYDVTTSWIAPAGQTINGPAFLTAEIAPVGQQTWTDIFTSYAGQATAAGRTCCSFSDFVFVGGVTSAPPTITIATPASGATYALNEPVVANYSCTPAPSGPPVTACIGDVPNNSNINTSSVGTMTFTVNATVSGGAAAVETVSYTVTYGPLASVSPSSIDFGTVYLGTITVKSVTVTNTGSAPLAITDPFLSLLSGGTSNEFVAVNLCPKSLAPGDSCTMDIGFFAGPNYTPQTAVLNVVDNAYNSPQTVALSATVINPVAWLSPMTLSFGPQKVNTSSPAKTVTLENLGTTPLAINNITVAGADPQDFLPTINCPGSLAPHGSCTVNVAFQPTALGLRSAELVVTDNAPLSKQIVSLWGIGD
jgi:hypothetical protein